MKYVVLDKNIHPTLINLPFKFLFHDEAIFKQIVAWTDRSTASVYQS